MPNYRRLKTPGASYFFIVVTKNRNPVLCHPSVRKALREAITCVRINMPFTIEAFVLLPDHSHCIWTMPEGDCDYGKRWGKIKGLVSGQCESLCDSSTLTDSEIKRGESHFWQRRFWEHQIRDEQDFYHHLDYVHYNPVKHGLCNCPSEWAFSSIHRYIAKGYYSPDWGLCVNLPDGVGHE